jgi:hypothetical protein
MEGIGTQVERKLEQIRSDVHLRLEKLEQLVDQRAQSHLERQALNLERFHAYTQAEKDHLAQQTQQLLDALRWHDHNTTLPVDQRVPLVGTPPRAPPAPGH